MEAKEDFEQSVSRQQRSMWAAAGGWGSHTEIWRRERAEKTTRDIASQGPTTFKGPVEDELLNSRKNSSRDGRRMWRGTHRNPRGMKCGERRMVAVPVQPRNHSR